MRILTAAALAALFLFAGALAAAPDDAVKDLSGAARVVVRGAVPDDASRRAIVAKLQALYGPERVVDQLTTSTVVAPARWTESVASMINADLGRVSNGEISVRGYAVTLLGEVPDEATGNAALASLRRSFDSDYVIHPALQVVTSRQAMLDQALAHRTIEFESGSSTLTPGGMAILDEMAAVILRLHDPSIRIIGNTDSTGERRANVQLSLQRASAARAYLVGKGVPTAALSVAGAGPDRPIADNDTAEGRARNRRTDFRVADR